MCSLWHVNYTSTKLFFKKRANDMNSLQKDIQRTQVYEKRFNFTRKKNAN